MVRMVDDLFELSRIHAGVLRLTPEPVALGDLVSEAIAGADPVARAAASGSAAASSEGARGDRRPGRAVPGGLQPGDERDPAHPRRRRRSRSAGRAVPDGVELSVTDGCGGIADEDMARVFDVAWQGECRAYARQPTSEPGAARRRPRAGHRARGIVEAHRGAVAVENEPPGCRFRVLLPAVPT